MVLSDRDEEHEKRERILRLRQPRAFIVGDTLAK